MSKRRHRPHTKDATPAAVGISTGKWLVMILALHVALALVYWYYTPFGAPPDEGPHGLYVESLVENKAFPVFSTTDRSNYEAHQPPLYYLLSVPFWLAGKLLGIGEVVVTVRLLSVILGGVSILVIFRTVRAGFPDDPDVAVGAAGFAALLPTHVMLSSSVSNDILVELVFGLALLVIALMIRDAVTWRRTILLGAILGIGLLSKTTCILLFPIAGLAYLTLCLRKEIKWCDGISHLAAAVGIGLLIGGGWLIRNHLLYGDPFAMSQFQEAFHHTAKPEFWLSRGWTWSMYFALVGAWTFASFWGVFGHMKVFMPAWVYWGLGLISLFVAAGAYSASKAQRVKAPKSTDVLLIFGTAIILVFLAFVQFNLSYFQAQGRYLYPALAPISLIWALGISRFIPLRRRYLLPCMAIGIPLIVQVIALFTAIIPCMPGYSM